MDAVINAGMNADVVVDICLDVDDCLYAEPAGGEVD